MYFHSTVVSAFNVHFKGLESFPAGRREDSSSIALATVLHDAGFVLRRLKTG